MAQQQQRKTRPAPAPAITPAPKKVERKAPPAAVAPPKKLSEIDALRAQIGKERGVGKVQPASKLADPVFFSTGSFLWDYATLGGWQDGRGSLVYGNTDSAKSTLTYIGIANLQRKHPKGIVALADTEHMFDPTWAETLGVDLDRLEMVTGDHCQEVLDLLIAYMGAEEVVGIALDSIVGLVPKAMDEKSLEDHTMAERARILGTFTSKVYQSWTREARRDHVVSVMATNQFRSSMSQWGDPRTLPGGRSINYFCKARVETKMVKVHCGDKGANPLPENGVKIEDCMEITFKQIKHKGGSIGEGVFRINVNPYHPDGLPVGAVDDSATVVTYGKRWGLVTWGGSSWRFEDSPKARSMEDLRLWLLETPAAMLSLKRQCISAQRVELGLPALPPDGYLCGAWA